MNEEDEAKNVGEISPDALEAVFVEEAVLVEEDDENQIRKRFTEEDDDIYEIDLAFQANDDDNW